MINEKELRIGNYIQINDEPLKGMQVYGYIKYLFQQDGNLGRGCAWIDVSGSVRQELYENIHPIPLTSKILNRTAFSGSVNIQSVEGGSNEHLSQRTYVIEVYDCDLELKGDPFEEINEALEESDIALDPGWIAYLSFTPKNNRMYIRPIASLHELQNLYHSLTGTELTINL